MSERPNSGQTSGQTSGEGATTAQVKGDIQSGLTGDKVGGLDPGAAPLGTDEEAGGAVFPPEEIARVRAQERAGRPTDGSANAATPSLQPDAKMKPQRNLVLAGVVGLAAAALLIAVIVAAL